ncbi:YjfB family protein [Massilia sp. LXY-6]|uniref:YjfB family protein n=1 Tax=Massilia sp. LXY-6 TaxID=3379823 RepID=UPI003EE420CA
MDVMGVAKLATSIADTGTRQDVSIAVLKRAQDIQASAATQLLDAVQSAAPAPQLSQNLPAHLGKNVNTTA